MKTEDLLAKIVFSDSGRGGDKIFGARKLIATIPDFKKFAKDRKAMVGVGFDLESEFSYSSYVNFNKEYWKAASDLLDVERALSDWSPDAALKVASLIKEHIKILE